MRRVRYRVAMSLDGYIAGPNGEADWIVMDPDMDFRALWASFDTLIMGRKTYDVVRSQKGPSMPGVSVYVFSRTLAQKDCKGVSVSDDPKATVAQLKTQPGKDIWLFGGGDLFRNMLELGLVDRVEVGIVPVLLGRGIPLLPETDKRRKLKLAAHKHYPKTGVLMLDYDVVR